MDVQAASDEPEWSQGTQDLLSWLQYQYCSKLKATPRRDVKLAVPSVSWEIWQELQPHTALVSVKGDIPSASAKKCDPVDRRPQQLRPRPAPIDSMQIDFYFIWMMLL